MDITDMHTVTPDEASYEVTKGWTRSIQRDDGVIFLVDLGHAQRGAVQLVF